MRKKYSILKRRVRRKSISKKSKSRSKDNLRIPTSKDYKNFSKGIFLNG